MKDVYVLGARAHPWGKLREKPQLQMVIEATTKALEDAGVKWKDIERTGASSAIFGGGMWMGLP